MTYSEVAHFAQTWGLALLIAGFLAAIAYALWPGNRAKFEHARRLPLEEDDNGRA